MGKEAGMIKAANQGNHTANQLARGHTHWCTLSLVVTAKSMSESFMLWIKPKAILKYRVNDFSDFYFLFSPLLLINVIHWLIHRIAGKEKSSICCFSKLLWQVHTLSSLILQTTTDSLLKTSSKEVTIIIFGGSFSTYFPFHVTDPLTVSLKISVLTGRLWSSSRFLIFLLWLQRRSSYSLGTFIWFSWKQTGWLPMTLMLQGPPLPGDKQHLPLQSPGHRSGNPLPRYSLVLH